MNNVQKLIEAQRELLKMAFYLYSKSTHKKVRKLEKKIKKLEKRIIKEENT